MARSDGTDPVVQSIFDRLQDDSPGVTRERPQSHVQIVRDLRKSVMRDVGKLLNTRCRPVAPPADLKELSPSLIDYGVPDFVGTNFVSVNAREEFRAIVEDTLRRYEPRFRTVKVQLLDNSDPRDRTLRFRVDALLEADPAPEPVSFDSQLEPVHGELKLEARRSE